MRANGVVEVLAPLWENPIPHCDERRHCLMAALYYYSQLISLSLTLRYVLTELIETEKLYVDDLGLIVEVCDKSIM
jgi:hypothetical protein